MMISNPESKRGWVGASVNFCERMALGSLALLLLGPLIAGLIFATTFVGVGAMQGTEALRDLFSTWLNMSLFASAMAYYLGWVPAALVGAIMGACSRWIKRGWFIFGSVLASITITFVWAAWERLAIVPLLAPVLSIPSVVLLSAYLNRKYGRRDSTSIGNKIDSFDGCPEEQINDRVRFGEGVPINAEGPHATSVGKES